MVRNKKNQLFTTFITTLLGPIASSKNPEKQKKPEQPRPRPSNYIQQQNLQNIGKKTLVLDLDETLITTTFCTYFQYRKSFKQIQKPKNQYTIEIPNGSVMTSINVVLRPGVQNFLKIMSEYYEIIIFTASCQEYADPIIQLLDPDNQYISGRLYRQHCEIEGIKDLFNLGREMKNIIIIDNNSKCFERQEDNGYKISDFTVEQSYCEEQDLALFDLIPFLKYLSDMDDVRPVNKQKEKFDQLQNLEKLQLKNQIETGSIGSQSTSECIKKEGICQCDLIQSRCNNTKWDVFHQQDNFFYEAQNSKKIIGVKYQLDFE